MPEYRFSLSRLFPCKNRIEDAVLIRGNRCHRKSVIWHILCSDLFKELGSLTYRIFPHFPSSWCKWVVGLAFSRQDLTHEISIFVKIIFNFKKKNVSLNKGKPSKKKFLPKSNNLNWLHHVTLKNLFSPKPAWQSVKSSPFEKFKVIASLPILCQYFRFFFFFNISQKIQ